MFKPTTCLTLLLGFLAISLAYRVDSNYAGGFHHNAVVNIHPFVQIGNGLYFIESRLKANWYAANERCHSMGAELISFETIDEWNQIHQYLYNNAIMDIYWTSGTELAKQGSHVWSATGHHINLTSIWANRMPDRWNNNEHCDEFGFKEFPSDRRGLNDRICTQDNYYICESTHARTVEVVGWY